MGGGDAREGYLWTNVDDVDDVDGWLWDVSTPSTPSTQSTKLSRIASTKSGIVDLLGCTTTRNPYSAAVAAVMGPMAA